MELSMKIIHDGDAAYEDIMALSLLLLNADVVAITVAYGESTTRIGALNMERVCRMLKPLAEIPIGFGTNEPLALEHATPFPEFINTEANDILNKTDVPVVSDSQITGSAVDLLYETLMSSDEKITIVATGPLTNIAQLLITYPECVSQIEQLVIMGGAVDVPGNISDLIHDTTNLVAEWNIYADREAARVVFTTENLSIKLVPIDITRQMPMTRAFLNGLSDVTLPALKLVKDMLTSLLAGMGEELFYGKLQFWDSLSAMIALDSSMAEFQALPITIDLNTGQTIKANAPITGVSLVHVATKLKDPVSAYEMFRRLMQTTERNHNPATYKVGFWAIPDAPLPPKSKVSFIGLLGAGKSTTANALVSLINKQGGACSLISSDDIVITRMKNPQDPVIRLFQKRTGILIDQSVFVAESPTASFIKQYGEPRFRFLEELFVIDIINNAQAHEFLDLGGKVPLRKSIATALKASGIILVYLQVNAQTIESHLSVADNGKTRGMYKLAEEQGNGWRNLALQQRQERVARYQRVADIVIDADNKTAMELVFASLEKIQEKFGTNMMARLEESTEKTAQYC